MAQRYPKGVSIKDGAVVFDRNGAKDIVPSKLVGKLFTWDLTEEDMQFISSQVNGTSQFTIPNTPYDNLEYTRSSASLAFFISELICIFLIYFVFEFYSGDLWWHTLTLSVPTHPTWMTSLCSLPITTMSVQKGGHPLWWALELHGPPPHNHFNVVLTPHLKFFYINTGTTSLLRVGLSYEVLSSCNANCNGMLP